MNSIKLGMIMLAAAIAGCAAVRWGRSVASSSRWSLVGVLGRRRMGGRRFPEEAAMTTIVAMIRFVHNAAFTLLVASGGFMVGSVVAHYTAGFESWSDSLAITYLWNFALALALYALLAVLLVSRGVVRLTATRRCRVQP
jgi:hypothetical protein